MCYVFIYAILLKRQNKKDRNCDSQTLRGEERRKISRRYQFADEGRDRILKLNLCDCCMTHTLKNELYTLK